MLTAINCVACKAPCAMKATRDSKFGQRIRAIGWMLMLPSLGILGYGLLLLLSTFKDWIAADASTDFFGSPYGAVIGLVMGTVAGFSGLFLGLVAWTFLARRNVFRCELCGHVLDRAT